MGFEVGVLDPLRPVDGLVDGRSLGEALHRVADLGMERRDDVAVGMLDPGRMFFRMQQGCTRRHGGFGVEDGRQDVVPDVEPPAAFLGRAFGFGHHGRDPLAAKPHDVVEHPRVERIVAVEFVAAGGKQDRGCVLVRQHRDDARDSHGGRRVDRHHAGMGMRRPQELDVQQALGRDIGRVAHGARDDSRSARRAEMDAFGRPRPCRRSRPRRIGSRCSGRDCP